jgi:hypothetical protein
MRFSSLAAGNRCEHQALLLQVLADDSLALESFSCAHADQCPSRIWLWSYAEPHLWAALSSAVFSPAHSAWLHFPWLTAPFQFLQSRGFWMDSSFLYSSTCLFSIAQTWLSFTISSLLSWKPWSHILFPFVFLFCFGLVLVIFFYLIFIVLLFICAYIAWVISPPCPHPLPYHPLCSLLLPPNPSIPSRNYFALISNFVVERV